MARERNGAIVWASGTVAWVLGLVAARPLIGSDPVTVLAQASIETAPGPLATWAIETFGKGAQPLAMVGISIGLVTLGAVFGAGRSRLDLGYRRRLQFSYAVGLGLFAVTAIGFAVAAGGISTRWLLATGIGTIGPAAVWWAWHGTRQQVGRRRALRRMSGAAGTVLAGGVLARTVGQSGSVGGVQPGEDLDPIDEKTATGTTEPTPTATADREPLGSRTELDGVVVSSSDSDAAFGFDFEGMPDRVGSADDHYVVDKNFSPPDVSAEDWALTISGAVSEPTEFTFEDLRTHPERRDVPVTMACISNTVGGNLIGTAEWTGVPVRSLLEAAGVEEEAVDVVTQAADGYSEAIPWSVVSERDDILLAVGMDGETLPAEHGFPARLLIPGRYGMKSTKWVTDFELATADHEAYWEQRGWDETAVVNTLSSIRAVQRRGDRVAIGGIAYGGVRGIDRVEVSLDGGDTWADATLETPSSPHTWRRWRRSIERPETEPADLVVRAIDGNGTRQTSEHTDPHPGGSTGWHSVRLSV